MADDPLDAVYSFVERAYIRLQAGDILIRCVDEGSAAPMHQMVEGLVLAGPSSLAILREILAESGQRKSQVQDDLSQVFNELERKLKSYGVQLESLTNSAAVQKESPANFIAMIRNQGITEEGLQVDCLSLFNDSRDVMLTLTKHIKLLEEIETYLQDWLWGLAYQSARQERKDSQDPPRSMPH